MYGIVEYITPTLPVYLAIHFVHIVYIVYMFSCIAYEPMAYGINELELESLGIQLYIQCPTSIKN